MGEIAQGYFKRYKYVLDGPLGEIEISSPKNYEADKKVFKRSTEVHGVFINLSSGLEFYRGDELNDGGYNYLKLTYEKYGINAAVTMTRHEDVSGVWQLDYKGDLDYSTYIREEHYIKLKFNESGLYQKIKARQRDAFEFNREETMDGIAMNPLSDIVEICTLDGRTIYFISQLVRTSVENRVEIPSGDWNKVVLEKEFVEVKLDHDELGNYEAIVVPVTLLSEQEGSQENGNVETVRVYDIKEDENSYAASQDTTAMMFYSDSADVGEIKFDIDIDLEFRDHGSFQTNPDRLRIDIVKFRREDDTTFTLIGYETLLTLYNPRVGEKHTIQTIYEDITEIGSSYCLAVHSYNESTSNQKDVWVTFTKVDILITDPSYYEASVTNCLLPFEAMERTLKVITNEDDILRSTLLGRTDLGYEEDGFASLMLLTNGFWVRLFNDKPIKTSFRDFANSFQVIAQMGYAIEKEGYKEIVRMEHIKYFYRDIVTIPILDRPSDIVRTLAKEYFFSSIEIGYKYPTGDNLYEEQQGLDEYNIRNKYISIIDRIESAFEYISQFSTDGYGKEFARRLPITKYPERDTRYDQRIMLMDGKRALDGSTAFQERKWSDDFEVPYPFNKQTTGVYSPETAVNLRLSPMNTLHRWGFWISSCLQKYPDDYVRFIESNGNSTLKTKYREDLYGPTIEYSEDGKIKNSNFSKSLFNPEYVTFEYPIDREMLDTIQGTTKVGDETVLNRYGLVAYINEDNKIEFGFLMEAEPNDNKWKLLQSTREPIDFIDERTPVELPTTKEGFNYDLNFDVN